MVFCKKIYSVISILGICICKFLQHGSLLHLYLDKLCANANFLLLRIQLSGDAQLLKKGRKKRQKGATTVFNFKHCSRYLFQDGSCASFVASQAVHDQSLTLFLTHLRDLHPQSQI